jgi:N,N'-diacetyllegionaminate synthase
VMCDIPAIEIGGRRIGPGEPCFVIAEAGVNHNGDLGRALELVDAAVEAGADAVKYQTFSTDLLVTKNAPKAAYQAEATGADESQYEMLRQLELPPNAFREIQSYCREKQILFLSTPFDDRSAAFLNELGLPAFKVPSGEITNLPFLRTLSRYGKPLIVSTGTAYLSEVEQAVRTITSTGVPFALLHCVSAYPADPCSVNLRAMATMAAAFRVPVGYSDHTLGLPVSLGAVALGACIVEKHFTIDRNLPGPDHRASLEPGELRELVYGIRMIEQALGDGRKRPAEVERDTARVARKSVIAARTIPAGAMITGDMLVIRRPGTGLPPDLWEQVIERTARIDIPAGTPLTWDLLA